MRGTATAGQVVGWILIVVGAVLAPVALFGGYDDVDWRLRSSVRMASVAQGLSAIAGGVAFLLGAGILNALIAMRDEAQADRGERRARERADERRRLPDQPADGPRRDIGDAERRAAPPAPAGHHPPASVQSRFSMIVAYGEPLGGRAWDLMEAGRRRGLEIPEGHAVAKARKELGEGHG